MRSISQRRSRSERSLELVQKDRNLVTTDRTLQTQNNLLSKRADRTRRVHTQKDSTFERAALRALRSRVFVCNRD